MTAVTDHGTIKPFEPNAFGKIKNAIDESPLPVSLAGGIIYNMLDNLYISVGQLGANRFNLAGQGVDNNQVLDAGISTMSSVLFRGTSVLKVNIAQFNKAVGGTSLARLASSTKGSILKAYNTGYAGQVKYTFTGIKMSLGLIDD